MTTGFNDFDFDFSEFDNYPIGHPMSFGAEIQRQYLDGFSEIINRSSDTQDDKIVGIPSGMNREELYNYIKQMRDHVRKEQGLEEYED